MPHIQESGGWRNIAVRIKNFNNRYGPIGSIGNRRSYL